MSDRRDNGTRRHTLAAALAGTVALVAPAAGAAELVMFTRPGCPWCATWEREVGDAYARTEIAEVAPLRRVPLHENDTGGLALDRGVRVTPTFVLAQDGREVGRIPGYPGESHFWTRLEGLIDRLKTDGSQSAEDTP